MENIENKNKKELKKERQEKRMTGKKIIGIVLWAVVLVAIGGVILWVLMLPKLPQSEIVSNSGIHWHPKISISINGEDVEIPANIGIGAVHSPMHTHDTDGVIHMEYGGLVRAKDILLGNFFKTWGKEFSSGGIMGKINGKDGTLKMTVNGVENSEFENYSMKDGDIINITFK